MQKSKEKTHTIVHLSDDLKESVKIGDIAIKAIHKQLNITSSAYDFSFPFEEGTLDDDAGFFETIGHGLAGRSYSAMVYASAELKSDLLQVKEEDIQYDEQTKILYIQLEKPTLHVWLNHDKINSDSFEALFSNRYNANEINAIYHKMEQVAVVQFEETELKNIEEAKEDIISGLEELLSPNTLIKKANAPKELQTLIKEVVISFKE